jgi:hypothetical protein
VGAGLVGEWFRGGQVTELVMASGTHRVAARQPSTSVALRLAWAAGIPVWLQLLGARCSLLYQEFGVTAGG